MSVLFDPSTSVDTAVFLAYGIHSTKATAALPQSTTGHLFTVAGGRVIVTLLVGEVTTIIQAQATTLKITATPTTGTAVDLCATADLNALEVGGKVSLIGTFATALNKTNAGAVQGRNVEPIIVATGFIDAITVASSTGSMKWDIFWFPLDSGATVA